MSSATERAVDQPVSPIHGKLADVNEIRLLHLQPGDTNDPIICRLVHVNFDDKPQYEALSYMWGSEDSPRQIDLNGTIFDVRNNLWQALTHLRLRNAIRILWIDALCINQNDDIERNHQVSQMGRIYKNAECVIIWLGLPDESSWVVWEYILDFQPPPFSDLFGNGEPRPFRFYHPIVMSGKTMDAITTFCSREYWTRLWIIQEVLFAPRIMILCGHWDYDWDKFSLFLRTAKIHLVKRHHRVRQGKSAFKTDRLFSKVVNSQVWRLCQTREHLGAARGLSLEHLCLQYSSSKCTDRRDKIFGLLALSADCCRQAVEVDYSSSMAELCLRFLFHCEYFHPTRTDIRLAITDRAEKLHRALSITAKDLEILDSSIGPVDSDTGVVMKDSTTYYFAPFSGQLSHTSGPLGTNWDEEEMEMPHAAFPSTLRPHRGKCIYSKGWKGNLGQTDQLKLVSPLNTEIAYIKRSKFRRRNSDPWYRSQLRKGTQWIRQTCVPWQRVSLEGNSWRSLDPIVNFMRAAAVKSDSCGYQFAVDESGLMLFVPAEAKVGDFVCQGQHDNTLVIVRPTRNIAHLFVNGTTIPCQLIGRGILLFDVLRANGNISCRCLLGGRADRPKMLLFRRFAAVVTLSTLQRLTIGLGESSVSDSDIK